MNPQKCECHECTQSRIHPMERNSFNQKLTSVCISRADVLKAYQELIIKSEAEAAWYYFKEFRLSGIEI